jgi:hypothetical protein
MEVSGSVQIMTVSYPGGQKHADPTDRDPVPQHSFKPKSDADPTSDLPFFMQNLRQFF